jgi:predicted dehydrogenase
MRVVLVGLGVASRFWLPPLLAADDVELAAVVEPDPERRDGAVAAHGLACPAFARLEEALPAIEPDVVANLTPPNLHREVVEQALGAGCHVLTEKPLAGSYRDACALVQAARDAGRTLAVMQNRRYHPGFRALRDTLAAGAIGQPQLLAADLFLEARARTTYLHRLAQPLLLDLAVHTFDQARFLAGADAISVDCRTRAFPGVPFAGPTAADCRVELSNGALLSYRGCCTAPGPQGSYDASWRIVGTDGSLLWDGEGVAEDDPTGHRACLTALLDALRHGTQPETAAADNLRSLAIAFAAVRSAEERRPVLLEELEG